MQMMWRQCPRRVHLTASIRPRILNRAQARGIRTAGSLRALKPFILSDPGEGIKEVQIIQWFVEPGARVEQFDPIVEVQTDKATNEITSRYDGVIKELHFDADEVVQVGQALLEIDVPNELDETAEKTNPSDDAAGEVCLADASSRPTKGAASINTRHEHIQRENIDSHAAARRNILTTPAVRGLLKSMNLDIQQVQGTGRDGRVTKEDVYTFAKSLDQATSNNSISNLDESYSSQSVRERGAMDRTRESPSVSGTDAARTGLSSETDAKLPLTAIQSRMFVNMTKSLQIPHFLYADEVDLTAIKLVRQKANASDADLVKLTYLPFVIKALSIVLKQYPILNARLVHNPSESQDPHLVLRTAHNIGIAVDTPKGLLVPNIPDTASLSLREIATHIDDLKERAKSATFESKHLSGTTMTVSNIGSIGGTFVTPMLVEGQLAILGLGKARDIPAFDDGGNVVRKTVVNLSWCADHRVIDGATIAKAANAVKACLEDPGVMLMELR